MAQRYCVRPNSGTIPVGASVDIQVTLQPQKDETEVSTVDKFLIQSVPVTAGMDTSDVSKLISANKASLGERKLKSQYTLMLESGGARSTKTTRGGESSGRTVEALQKERNEYREQLTRLNVDLKKTKAELEKMRASGGSDLSNRFANNSGAGASSSSSGSAKAKSGHSSLILLLIALIMFAGGFYTHMHFFPELEL